MNGLFGPTVLTLHEPFSLDTGVVIDDLHGLYLGVSDTFLDFWFSKKFKDHDFYIGGQVRTNTINKGKIICLLHT